MLGFALLRGSACLGSHHPLAIPVETRAPPLEDSSGVSISYPVTLIKLYRSVRPADQADCRLNLRLESSGGGGGSRTPVQESFTSKSARLT